MYKHVQKGDMQYFSDTEECDWYYIPKSVRRMKYYLGIMLEIFDFIYNVFIWYLKIKLYIIVLSCKDGDSNYFI